jgi:hypothetical protein
MSKRKIDIKKLLPIIIVVLLLAVSVYVAHKMKNGNAPEVSQLEVSVVYNDLAKLPEYNGQPFAVINADDFYGRSAYQLLSAHFANEDNLKGGRYAMVGYVLENTLTENGTVSRGICNADENGMLTSVVERTAIMKEGDVAVCGDVIIPLDSIASMNCWGFTPDVFDALADKFAEFLAQEHENPLKCEFYLPFAVCNMLEQGQCSVKVYRSMDAWYGVTYKEDKEFVVSSIEKLKADGVYPHSVANS